MRNDCDARGVEERDQESSPMDPCTKSMTLGGSEIREESIQRAIDPETLNYTGEQRAIFSMQRER